MTISRIDLDGAGSPAALVTRILHLEPALPIPVPIEQLCQQLDITSIGELDTDGFEAALITDEFKSAGAILIARDRSRQRRRFSIAHELGHFLIPAHLPRPGEQSLCSAEQLCMTDIGEQNRRRRMEAEANRFAALLLMPPPMLRAELQRIRQPNVTDIIRLARLFDVSKDAMGRAYADYSREAVAIVVIRNGKVMRHYRNVRTFPFISVSTGQSVPVGSLYHSIGLRPGEASPTEECERGIWIGERDEHRVGTLTEQLLGQENGFSLLMLLAELKEEDEDEDGPPERW